MKSVTTRVVLFLLAICLWATGNALLFNVPVRADDTEVAQNDPNNPTCIDKRHEDDFSNCFMNNKQNPGQGCNPSGYCKKIMWKDWFCSPGDTGTQDGTDFYGQPIIIKGNCHTTTINKNVPVFYMACQYDPTVFGALGGGCACPSAGDPGNPDHTTVVSSTSCTDNTASYALNEPSQRYPPRKSNPAAQGITRTAKVQLQSANQFRQSGGDQ